MKHVLSIFAAAVLSAATHATQNPLGAGIAGYTYTKPTYADRLEGRIIGYGMDYRAFRMEDMYYLAEALGERTYTVGGRWIREQDYFGGDLLAYKYPNPVGSAVTLGHLELDRFAPQSYSSGNCIFATETPLQTNLVQAGSFASMDAAQYISATHTNSAMITSDMVAFPLKPFPSLSDLTNTYAKLDMVRCVFSPVFGVYASDTNMTVAVISQHEIYDGETIPVDVWTNRNNGGYFQLQASQAKVYQWFRSTEDDQWELEEEHLASDWDTLSAFGNSHMRGSYGKGMNGIMFAATTTPHRVKSGVAVVRFMFVEDDWTWRNGDTLGWTQSTNSVLMQCAVSATNGFFRVELTKTMLDDAMELCSVHVPVIEDVPIPSGNIYPDGGYGAASVVFGHERTLSVWTDAILYYYATDFRTTLNGGIGQ